MLHPLFFPLCWLFFGIHADAGKGDREYMSGLLHSVDMISKSLSHPLRNRYERLGPIVEHAEMQHVLKHFLPTMRALERVESPVRLSIKPYEVMAMPCREDTIQSMRRAGRRTILVKFYLHFYLRLPPWQGNNYLGTIYRVTLKDPIDFMRLEAKLKKGHAKMPLPPVPLLYAPIQPLSSGAGVLRLPIEKSYHPNVWNRSKHGYSNVFAFLALSLQQDKLWDSPQKKFEIFLEVASALLPGMEMNVISVGQRDPTKDYQITTSLMQRLDPGDDILISPTQTSYRPYRERSAIVLARTVEIEGTLVMLILELPDSLQPVSQFSLETKTMLALLHERLVVHANGDEVEARIIREGDALFTQQFFKEFYTPE